MSLVLRKGSTDEWDYFIDPNKYRMPDLKFESSEFLYDSAENRFFDGLQ